MRVALIMIGGIAAVALALAHGPAVLRQPVTAVTAAVTAEPRALQPRIDATPAGATLSLEPGLYAGPVTIARPIEIVGNGAVIDGGGTGTVVTLATDDARLGGLVIRNSGMRLDTIDAGIAVRGSYNAIRDIAIENCLFGIDLQQANGNVVRRVRIQSKAVEQSLRGDAIRLWYAHDNRIEGNTVSDSRDIVVWYAERNRIVDNTVRANRYGIHFMYSHDNEVRGNRITESDVGIFLMYSNDITVQDNIVSRSIGPSGVGIGFKEASGVRILDNEVLGNAVGFYLDVSPFEPDTTNTFEGNRVAGNAIAFLFHNDQDGNIVGRNDLVSNFAEVVVRANGTALRNGFAANRWDSYAGVDRNADGTGDAPFEVWAYADRLWMDVPPVAFFRGSPALELLDFVERLAPFTEPRLIMRDGEPRMARVVEAVRAERAQTRFDPFGLQKK
jgi:nitrous oxidase accessory protein